LRAPSGLPVRPTTDRAKEGLFSWLNARIDLEGISVLDLFSGTGNISYECISRGAAKIVAVDKNPGCANFIREQFQLLGPGDFQVYCTDARIALERSRDSFDLIFADPPYDYKDHKALAESVVKSRLLTPGGWFILEHPSGIALNDIAGYQDTRHYGKVHFSFFNLNP
jgi:16S rRNA (guanine966-N2)-methyltransferase